MKFADLPHLTPDKRLRGEQTLTSNDGAETYKVFLCHGCQSCWHAEDSPDGDFTVVESYPHFLSLERI
jgi:hypothetical protein